MSGVPARPRRGRRTVRAAIVRLLDRAKAVLARSVPDFHPPQLAVEDRLERGVVQADRGRQLRVERVLRRTPHKRRFPCAPARSENIPSLCARSGGSRAAGPAAGGAAPSGLTDSTLAEHEHLQVSPPRPCRRGHLLKGKRAVCAALLGLLPLLECGLSGCLRFPVAQDHRGPPAACPGKRSPGGHSSRPVGRDTGDHVCGVGGRAWSVPRRAHAQGAGFVQCCVDVLWNGYGGSAEAREPLVKVNPHTLAGSMKGKRARSRASARTAREAGLSLLPTPVCRPTPSCASGCGWRGVLWRRPGAPRWTQATASRAGRHRPLPAPPRARMDRSDTIYPIRPRDLPQKRLWGAWSLPRRASRRARTLPGPGRAPGLTPPARQTLGKANAARPGSSASPTRAPRAT